MMTTLLNIAAMLAVPFVGAVILAGPPFVVVWLAIFFDIAEHGHGAQLAYIVIVAIWSVAISAAVRD